MNHLSQKIQTAFHIFAETSMKYCPLTNSKLGQHTIVQFNNSVQQNRVDGLHVFLAHPTKYDLNFW
jgi:hypothetical protein